MKLNIKDVLAALESDKNYLKSVPVGTIITGVYSRKPCYSADTGTASRNG